MIPFHKPGCGSHQVYLCLAPSAVFEGLAHKVTVTVRHTCQLRIRSKVADQSAGQRAMLDDAFDAAPNALRSAM